VLFCSFQVVSSFVLFGECVYVCCSMGVMPEIKIYIHIYIHTHIHKVHIYNKGQKSTIFKSS